MNYRSSVDRAPARCRGGHWFDSCVGFRIFLDLWSTLVSCWSVLFSRFISKLKIHHLYSLVNILCDVDLEVKNIYMVWTLAIDVIPSCRLLIQHYGCCIIWQEILWFKKISTKNYVAFWEKTEMWHLEAWQSCLTWKLVLRSLQGRWIFKCKLDFVTGL